MNRNIAIQIITILLIGLMLTTTTSFAYIIKQPIAEKKVEPKKAVQVYEPQPVLTEKEIIDNYVDSICLSYGIDSSLVKSIVWHESRYNPKATNGSCVGLMQISTIWHSQRASRLGVTDFYDPYSNLLIGIDYLSAIFKNHKDPALVLMLYNMDNNTALKLYKEGKITNYAKSVLSLAEKIRKEEVK